MEADDSWSVITDSNETVPHPAPRGETEVTRPVIRQIGPYDVERTLGFGGMGVVLRARHRKLEVDRAIKLMTRPDSVKGVARFKREAKNLSRTQHPNVVRIHEFGETDDGRLYFVMELVEGRALSRVLAVETLDLDRALGIAIGIAEGTQALHDAGVIHRDLKPGNIVLADDDRPVVLDLGLAVNPGLDERLTKTGTTLGTVNYMAPEQFKGAKQTTPLTDVYALGLLLYELTTGVPATDRSLSHHEVAGMVLHGERDGPSTENPDLPAQLDAVCQRAFAREPVDRYPSARAFADAVRALRSDPGPSVSAIRRRWSALIAAALLVITIVVVALAVPHPSGDDGPAAIDTSVDGGAPGLSPQHLADGRRRLDALAALPPEELWPLADEWLRAFPEHPDADRAREARGQALLQAPRLAFEHTGVRDVAFAGNDHVLTVGSDWHVRLWSARSGEKIQVWACKSALTRLAVAPDALACVAGGRRGELVYLELPSGTPRTLPSSNNPSEVMDIAFSAKGDLIAVAGENGIVDVRSLPGGERVWSFGPQGEPMTGVAFAAEDTRLICASGVHLDLAGEARKQRVRILDTTTREVVRTHMFTTLPQGVAVSGDGARFVVPGDGRRLILYDAASGDMLGEFSGEQAIETTALAVLKKAHDGVIRDAVVAPSLPRVYSISGEPGVRKDFNQIRVWNLDTREELHRILKRPLSLNRIDAAPDGKRIIIRAEHRVELWDLGAIP